MSLVPPDAKQVLDIGTRDGFFARLLADRGAEVVALDLEAPAVDHPGVTAVKGNATSLQYPDRSFDLVLCAEVLEHIPGAGLVAACRELARVSRRHVLIGVPFRQDLRLHRTRCATCGQSNPPWAHVNSFDESKLIALFDGMRSERCEYVGEAELGTNGVAEWLMDLAGNPYGTYSQEEPCVHCGASIRPPGPRSLVQRALTKASVAARAAGQIGERPHANWIHMLFGHAGPT